MKIKTLLALTAATLALGTMTAATAQTTTETKVSTDPNASGGTTTKVEHIHKHKTHHAKRILGVKVGHKTRVHKTVKETSTDANGAQTTTTKTVNK